MVAKECTVTFIKLPDPRCSRIIAPLGPLVNLASKLGRLPRGLEASFALLAHLSPLKLSESLFHAINLFFFLLSNC